MNKEVKDATSDNELGFLLAMRAWKKWLQNPEGATQEEKESSKYYAEEFAKAYQVSEESLATKNFLTFVKGIEAGIEIAMIVERAAEAKKADG